MGLRRRADRRVSFQFHPFYPSGRLRSARPSGSVSLRAGERQPPFGILTQIPEGA